MIGLALEIVPYFQQLDCLLSITRRIRHGIETVERDISASLDSSRRSVLRLLVGFGSARSWSGALGAGKDSMVQKIQDRRLVYQPYKSEWFN